MFITLSEKRDEKILIEWSDEITDEHAQDFCDVCNTALVGFYDLDYMRRKYSTNIYGKGLISIFYKDGKPIATTGARRNDLNGLLAFEYCDTCTAPEARGGAYVMDLFPAINDEVAKLYPDAYTYGFPNIRFWSVLKASGSTVIAFYKHIYHGKTKDFQESVPFIDDDYAEAFLLKRKNIRLCSKKIGEEFYLLESVKIKRVIPGSIIWGKISRKTAEKLRKSRLPRLIVYYSVKEGLFRTKYPPHVTVNYLGNPSEKISLVPPLYRADTNSIDYNGINEENRRELMNYHGRKIIHGEN